MRSVLAALPGHIRAFHLITADFPFEVPEDLSLLSEELIRALRRQGLKGQGVDTLDPQLSGALFDITISDVMDHWRIAQSPAWLDYSKFDPQSSDHPLHSSTTSSAHERLSSTAVALYPTFRYATHSEIFHLPTTDRTGNSEALGEREWKEENWRKQALPSFNSFSIESRVGWLHGLVSSVLEIPLTSRRMSPCHLTMISSFFDLTRCVGVFSRVVLTGAGIRFPFSTVWFRHQIRAWCKLTTDANSG